MNVPGNLKRKWVDLGPIENLRNRLPLLLLFLPLLLLFEHEKGEAINAKASRDKEESKRYQSTNSHETASEVGPGAFDPSFQLLESR